MDRTNYIIILRYGVCNVILVIKSNNNKEILLLYKSTHLSGF